MTNKTIRLVAALLIAASMASADMTLKGYRNLRDSTSAEAKYIAKMFVMGIADGLNYANAELTLTRREPLFCTPDRLPLQFENFDLIVEQEAEHLGEGDGKTKTLDYDVALVLMKGLIRTFPCPVVKKGK
jgi:hypothetical protein